MTHIINQAVLGWGGGEEILIAGPPQINSAAPERGGGSAERVAVTMPVPAAPAPRSAVPGSDVLSFPVRYLAGLTAPFVVCVQTATGLEAVITTSRVEYLAGRQRNAAVLLAREFAALAAAVEHGRLARDRCDLVLAHVRLRGASARIDLVAASSVPCAPSTWTVGETFRALGLELVRAESFPARET